MKTIRAIIAVDKKTEKLSRLSPKFADYSWKKDKQTIQFMKKTENIEITESIDCTKERCAKCKYFRFISSLGKVRLKWCNLFRKTMKAADGRLQICKDSEIS